MYWDTGTNELGDWNLEETHVEGFVWDGKDLEVGVLADSLCDELVQRENVWHRDERPWHWPGVVRAEPLTTPSSTSSTGETNGTLN